MAEGQEMKPLETARSEVLSAVRVLGTETVPIWEARGRVLSADVIAPEDVPPFPNSAMDGFAVRADDVSSPGAVLEVLGDLQAGYTTETEVGPGEAIKIMTGAPIPRGADTVVRVEDTATAGSKVEIAVAVDTGTSVRPAGGDVKRDQLVFEAGTRLTPMHVGVLATIGVAKPEVFKRPRVAYMSTGDELTPVETPTLAPGGIRDSNRPMLRALLEEAGAELLDLGIVPDDPDLLRAALDRGSRANVMVSTGGVSMGDYDVTKLVLEGDAGVEFWKIAIQPAKPFAFGRVGDALFFGLPGNPVSVLVSFEQFLRPALLRMQGARAVLRPQMVAVAGEDLDTDPEKTVIVRVLVEGLVEGVPTVIKSGGQSSNVLSAAAAADAFAVVPEGVATVKRGEPVTIEMFKWPETREWFDGR
ncbi:MAG TPA: gephyrin-like molybdotransferase Glp [Acidimicrobiia bacterium]|nr:gephyrin-like molybdotransferase Glp [Acidimicrobiia bacterium]